tara:strand:- start:587 stop:3082 length:2496 start_codon:yes stop_codon:yes gene_type:complete
METIQSYLGADFTTKLEPLLTEYVKQYNLLNEDERNTLIRHTLVDLIPNEELEKNTTTKPELRQERRIINREALKYLETQYKSGKHASKKPTTTTDGAIREALSIILNDQKELKYNEEQLTLTDLSGDFDPMQVTIPKKYKQRLENARQRETIDVKYLNDALKVPLKQSKNKELKKNIRLLITRIKKIYATDSSKPDDLEFSITDISLLKVFNTQNLSDFDKRETTYTHWKKVKEGLDEIIEEVLELSDNLEKLKSKDKDVIKFLEVIKNVRDINYVYDFPLNNLKLKEIDSRAIDFLEAFLKQTGYLSDALEVGFDSVGEVINTEQGQVRIADAAEETETDVMYAEMAELAEKYKEIYETHSMDVLGVLHFERNLNSLSLIGDESISSMKETLLNFFKALKDDDAAKKIIVDDKIEEAFDNFLGEIKSLGGYEDGDTYLPIYFAKEPELKEHYSNVDYERVTKATDDFLLAFKNLIEGDVKTQSPKQIRTGDLLGLGANTKKQTSAAYQLFSYNEYLEGRSGTQKELRSSVKGLNDKLHESIAKISELIDVNFSHQIFSPHLLGVELSFENDMSLRAISVSDFNDREKGEVNLFRVINKVFMTDGEAFIKEKDVTTLNGFLDLLSQGDSLANFTEIKKKAIGFYSVLAELYEDDRAAEKAKEEVASILGSIWRYKSNKKETFEGLDIKAAYDKIFVDELHEITTLQILADIIRKNQDMFKRDNKGQFSKEINKLLSNLDRVSKSEIHKKLLEAHDVLRILKSKSISYSMKNENNFDDMEHMIIKMEKEYQIDMSATEIIGIVGAVDSFEGIAKEYGLDAEHVYVLKANFR